MKKRPLDRVMLNAVMALLFPVRWVFYIPPVEKRPVIRGRLRYLLFMDYDRTRVETYIFYKAFILHLWLCLAFAASFALSFFCKTDIDLVLFNVRYQPANPVEELVYKFPSTVFPIVAPISVGYCIALFARKTDFFSKRRITTEHSPPPGKWTNPDIYKMRPLAFLLPIGFLIATGYSLWGLPEFLRMYDLYNNVYDFRAQNAANFILYTLLYLGLYQTFFFPVLGLAIIVFIRSVLRHNLYADDLINQ